MFQKEWISGERSTFKLLESQQYQSNSYYQPVQLTNTSGFGQGLFKAPFNQYELIAFPLIHCHPQTPFLKSEMQNSTGSYSEIRSIQDGEG